MATYCRIEALEACGAIKKVKAKRIPKLFPRMKLKKCECIEIKFAVGSDFVMVNPEKWAAFSPRRVRPKKNEI
jgi:hypothetical protein